MLWRGFRQRCAPCQQSSSCRYGSYAIDSTPTHTREQAGVSPDKAYTHAVPGTPLSKASGLRLGRIRTRVRGLNRATVRGLVVDDDCGPCVELLLHLGGFRGE